MTTLHMDVETVQGAQSKMVQEKEAMLGELTSLTSQINQAWNDLERAYSSDVLECTPATSRFLDEGEQFGMRVQYWQVNLQGTKGWSASSNDREYWLQVAEENSNWKLNRVLTSDEVAYYLAIDSMSGEDQ